MTLEEAAEIGRQKLIEYEPHLRDKVRGVKPYSRQYAKQVCQQYEGSILPLKQTVEHMVDSVLTVLLSINGTFWVSEPEPDHDTLTGPVQGPLKTVRHSHFNLTFSASPGRFSLK